ncbi:sel1 repeat family protein [Parvibaculum lavamentivorans]|uniref:sel1 repeat family protein n=1 Tax=Parvibaculum lavamentivorans TaxID=256618 RepID=UPI000325EB1F|nr:sel1 repeat family protein [Parvibaculum lavamentivorans]
MPVNRVRLTSPAGAIIMLCFAAFAISACGGGGASRKRDADGNIVPTLAEQDPTGTLYAGSIGKAARGECDERTLDVLTCFAYRGHGYEGAQTALGQCLIATGDRAEGLEWVRRAANTGWPDAQKLMAMLLIDDAAPEQDVVQAAKWAKLYGRNPSLLSLGVVPDRSVAEAMAGKISPEQMALADGQVQAWRPVYWTPNTAIDESIKKSCQVEGRRPAPRRQDIPIMTAPLSN